MATIKKRGDAWRAQVCVNGQRDSRTFDTFAEGKAWASSRETELRSQQPLVQTNAAAGTLRELLNEVKRHKTPLCRTERSRQVEEGRINRLMKHPISDQA
jgi:hypothetical protein